MLNDVDVGYRCDDSVYTEERHPSTLGVTTVFINTSKLSLVMALGFSVFATNACVAEESAADTDTADDIAAAAVGSGWREYTDGAYVHFQVNGKYIKTDWKDPGTATEGDGVYRYDADSDTETFILRGNRTNRIEFHGAPYKSGQQQLEGEVRVNDSATDHVWVAQAWHTALIRYERADGGSLVYHSASEFNDNGRVDLTKTLAKGVRGKWTKVNMIHNASTNRIQIYINNELALDHPTGDTNDEYYLKYGTYDASGSDDETVQWRKTKVYRK